MSKIIRYCKLKEEHDGENSFDVSRPNILGNPYTHIKNRKTKAMVIVKNREEAIRLYSDYFDQMYKVDKIFKQEFDKIYEAYKKYPVIYLGCYCKEDEECHGDIIKNKLIQRSMKEKIKMIYKERKINEDFLQKKDCSLEP